MYSKSAVGWFWLSIITIISSRISRQKRTICSGSDMQPTAVRWRSARQAVTSMKLSCPSNGSPLKRRITIMSAARCITGKSVSTMNGAIEIVFSSMARVNMSMKRYIGLSYRAVSGECRRGWRTFTYFSSRHFDNNEIRSSQNSTGRSDVNLVIPSPGILPRTIASKDSEGFDGNA